MIKTAFPVALAATLTLALCVAPITANASGVAIHKHKNHMHHAVPRSFNPAATALAPVWIVPSAPAVKADDAYTGLSRDRDECNRYGCIDY